MRSKPLCFVGRTDNQADGLMLMLGSVAAATGRIVATSQPTQLAGQRSANCAGSRRLRDYLRTLQLHAVATTKKKLNARGVRFFSKAAVQHPTTTFAHTGCLLFPPEPCVVSECGSGSRGRSRWLLASLTVLLVLFLRCAVTQSQHWFEGRQNKTPARLGTLHKTSVQNKIQTEPD